MELDGLAVSSTKHTYTQTEKQEFLIEIKKTFLQLDTKYVINQFRLHHNHLCILK